jgi:hypothetical protein
MSVLLSYLSVSALFAGTAEGTTFQARIARAEFYKVRGIKDRARRWWKRTL